MGEIYMYQDLNRAEFRADRIDMRAIPDVLLSKEMQDLLYDMFKDAGHEYARISAASSIVQSNGANYVLFPNTWYYVIARSRDTIAAILAYIRFIEKNVRPSKEILRLFAEHAYDDERIVALLPDAVDRERVASFIAGHPGKNAINGKAPAWTLRGKTDIFGSVFLKLLPMPDVSSNFIGTVAYDLGTRPDLLDRLAEEVLQMPVPNHPPVSASVRRVTGGNNCIVYGAPGTGKSHALEQEYGKDVTRVVFHPEYSYFDFIGSYRPSPVYAESTKVFHRADGTAFDKGEPYVDYAFVPGPFTNVLMAAWKHPEKMHNLLIEEMNRADAAAVFGDVFQLLDRDDDGQSRYGITPSAEWRDYLLTNGADTAFDASGRIRIPSNMNLLATMNSADQGVNVLDTAFKRRWSYRFMELDYSASCLDVSIRYGGRARRWPDFLQRINTKLIRLYRIGEDRLVGPFFVAPDALEADGDNAEAIRKVLFYLWDDVLRHESRERFFGDIRTMAGLYRSFPDTDIMGLYPGEEAGNPEDGGED